MFLLDTIKMQIYKMCNDTIRGRKDVVERRRRIIRFENATGVRNQLTFLDYLLY